MGCLYKGRWDDQRITQQGSPLGELHPLFAVKELLAQQSRQERRDPIIGQEDIVVLQQLSPDVEGLEFALELADTHDARYALDA